ncbi:SagB-type dehydrogenase family enzyme [Oxalobacteraceae bacterium GrIS 1.11]
MNKFLQDLLPPRIFYVNFDIDNPVEIFHEQTKYYRATCSGQVRSIARYLHNPEFISVGASGHHAFPNYALLDLPPPSALTARLGRTLAERRSVTSPAGELTLAKVSTLLHHALGVSAQKSIDELPHATLYLRPYPSPGALYPTEIYLFLNKVQGVAPCIAHYDARAHALRILSHYDVGQRPRTGLRSDEKSARAPLAIVLTTVPQRVTAKYGARGYRMGLLEAGHASQNVCLVAQGMGLKALPYGSYFDNEIEAELHLDGVTEAVAAVLLVGRKST